VVLSQQQRRTLAIGSGGYSRLLDLGGAPSSLHDKSKKKELNLNKNCRLQAIIFDFDVLTRSIEDSKPETLPPVQTIATTNKLPNLSETRTLPLKPDKGMVEEVANLLNVDLTGNRDKPIADQSFDDDLSLLTGEKPSSAKKDPSLSPPFRKEAAKSAPPATDIRAKYASKLKSAGFKGGLSAVDLAKHEIAEVDVKGDAAGHFAARAHATTDSASSSSSRWMAATGTGKLLNYLHQRSMKLALVATPVKEATKVPAQAESQRMDDFLKQMKGKVAFASVIKQDGTLTVDLLAKKVVEKLLSADDSKAAAAIAPDRCLWVSDRDDCLRAAKEVGLMTVRVRPKNARRGNVSSHYTVETIPETQEVINEINGISFNTVLQHGV